MVGDALKDHRSETRLVNIRLWVAVFFMLLLTAGLISRLFYLQVVRYNDMVTQSDENRVHLKPIPPTRGLIYDSNDQLLAMNRPSKIVSVVRERVTDMDELLHSIADIIDLDDREIERFKKRLRQVRPFEPVPLKYDLSDEQIAKIAVNMYRLQGVELDAELVRYYPQGKLYAHSVGYMGRINDREIKKLKAKLYSGTHSIGKIGLEKYYETDLLGQPGYQEVETNARGRVIRVLKQVDPVSGNNLHLYLNTDLQKKAVKAMDGRRGAIIALDPKTGGVLSMVSNPAFDPNLFVTGIDSKTFNGLNTDIERPLYNRATLGEYPPASTMKPMVALGLLANNIIDRKEKIFDKGWFQLPGSEHKFRNWRRWGHGWVDIEKALIVSNDTYFYNQASKLGIDALYQLSYQFGFGHRTGIDIGEERPGLLPSREWKQAVYGKPWYPGETVIAIIGQGYMLSTPLQLAEMITMIANRGKYVQPHLVKERAQPKGKDIKIGNPDDWEFVINAMEKVVSSPHGTANWRIGKNLHYRMAGKTGTAQVVSIAQGEEYDEEKLKEFERDHSLFIAFAPVDDPQIAVAVILENSSGASNVARDVMDFYLLPRLQQERLSQGNDKMSVTQNGIHQG
ncbi:Peptidoglycan D,D-transpeptidase MrdA [invertebrate metagenome]|uniref:Peptidoglycan D,D-transpeptidase MrdA n=1 Tax=invertebrate metagenome TaxID=1711999 RepID=A0A2H9T710_9ZZZZ